MKKISLTKLRQRIQRRAKTKSKQTQDSKDDEEYDDKNKGDGHSRHGSDVDYDRLSTNSETNATTDSNTTSESKNFYKYPTVLLQSFRNKLRKRKSKLKANQISESNQKSPKLGYRLNESKDQMICNSNEIDLNDESLGADGPEGSVKCDLLCDDLQTLSLTDNKETIDSNNDNTVDQNIAKSPEKKFSLVEEIERIVSNGWYWGPITRSEAEEKLRNQADGSFLVRDSSDDHYLFSLSFRSFGRTLHTRIEYTNGLFSFYSNGSTDGNSSLIDLIQESMTNSEKGIFCYSRGRSPVSPSFPVRLTRPISRFSEVRSLQYLCKFVIRQSTAFSQIASLPLPPSIRGFIANASI